MRFIIISIVFVLLVYGCAGNQTQRVNNEEISNEFAFEILLAKLKKNCESLICEQPGYLNCFNISSKQCYEETSPYRLECYDRASQKMPDILNEADLLNCGIQEIRRLRRRRHGSGRFLCWNGFFDICFPGTRIYMKYIPRIDIMVRIFKPAVFLPEIRPELRIIEEFLRDIP